MFANEDRERNTRGEYDGQHRRWPLGHHPDGDSVHIGDWCADDTNLCVLLLLLEICRRKLRTNILSKREKAGDHKPHPGYAPKVKPTANLQSKKAKDSFHNQTARQHAAASVLLADKLDTKDPTATDLDILGLWDPLKRPDGSKVLPDSTEDEDFDEYEHILAVSRFHEALMEGARELGHRQRDADFIAPEPVDRETLRAIINAHKRHHGFPDFERRESQVVESRWVPPGIVDEAEVDQFLKASMATDAISRLLKEALSDEEREKTLTDTRNGFICDHFQHGAQCIGGPTVAEGVKLLRCTPYPELNLYLESPVTHR